MRKFKLINASNEEFDLMRKDAFFHAPDGLGIAYITNVMQADRYFIETNRSVSQATPNGEMVFLGYEQYDEFMDFVGDNPLTLGYCPLDTWRYMDVRLGSIGKSEIDATTKRLICPIDFVCLSPWYESMEIFYTNTQQGEGKKYSYTYSYTYSDITRGSIALTNDGSGPAACRINILGPCTNPAWSLTQGGSVVATGRIEATIPNGSKLVVDSSPLDPEIAEYTISNAYEQNLYDASDFDTQRFIFIPQGNSTMQFSHEGADDISAFIEVRIPVV